MKTSISLLSFLFILSAMPASAEPQFRKLENNQVHGLSAIWKEEGIKLELGYSVDSAVDLPKSENNDNRMFRNSYGIYLLGEYAVYQEHSNQGLSIFARYGRAYDNVHQIGSYMGVGLSYAGLLPGRASDLTGIAFAVVNNKHYLATQNNSKAPTNSTESILELTHKSHITNRLALQPDIQWIINPDSHSSFKDKLQFGLRLDISI